MNNLEIIRSTYEGKNSEENGRSLVAYSDPEITWTEAEGFPYAGTYVGIESITENVFKKLATEWTDYKFTPEGYVAESDKVFAYGTYSGTNNKTGKSFAARVAHLWKLKNQKIISFEQFVDSKTVADTFS